MFLRPIHANTFGANGLVSRWTSTTTNTWYEFDPMGNVANYIDIDGATSRIGFDAYGAAECGMPSGEVFGYQAQWGAYTDAVTGFVLLTHRYYDPATGRFVTRDPIGYAGGINLYGYVGGDPVNFADPSGLKVKWGDVTPEFVQDVKAAKKYLSKDPEMKRILDYLWSQKSPTVTIEEGCLGGNGFDPSTNTIDWNPGSALGVEGDDETPMPGSHPPVIGFAHEAAHAAQFNGNRKQYDKDSNTPAGVYQDAEEKRVINGPERRACRFFGYSPRHNHNGFAYSVGTITGR